MLRNEERNKFLFQTWNEERNEFLFSARNEERNAFLKLEERLKLCFQYVCFQVEEFVRELNSLESRRGRRPLDVNNVIYWFKNTRAAVKRAEMKARVGYTAPSTGSNSPEKSPLGLLTTSVSASANVENSSNANASAVAAAAASAAMWPWFNNNPLMSYVIPDDGSKKMASDTNDDVVIEDVQVIQLIQSTV